MLFVCMTWGVGHDQVFSLYAPIRIFQKNKFPDPITDQIFDKNSDQIPIIDPIKNNAICQKKPNFLQMIIFFYFLWKRAPHKMVD